MKVCDISPGIAGPWMTLPRDLQHKICDIMSLFDIRGLALTSRYNYRLMMENVRRRVFDIFTKYGLDARETLGIMRDCKAIISGSTVLKVLEGSAGTSFEPANLDFLVPMDALPVLRNFVVDRSGYVPCPSMSRALIPESFDASELSYGTRSGTGTSLSHPRLQCMELAPAGIRHVKYFVHPNTRRTISILVTILGTSTSAVFLSHSTITMNFISWNTVFSAYPALTSQQLGIVNSARATENAFTTRALEKYKSRGYDIQRSASIWRPNHSCGISHSCPVTGRHILDSHTLWVGFYNPPAEQRDVIDLQLVWQLARTHRDCFSFGEEVNYGWVSAVDGTLGASNLVIHCATSD